MKRIPELDGLRACAIILVVLGHINIRIHSNGEYIEMLRAFAKVGFAGVTLFFVLSGFLIGSLVFQELQVTGTLTVKRFWMRRILRTWPMYFVALVLHLYFIAPTTGAPLWSYLTFTQNYFKMNVFIQSWSIAVEEQFYFIFPILIFLTVAWKKWPMTFPCLAVLLVVPTYLRAQHLWSIQASKTHLVMDALILGLLIAYIQLHRPHFLEKLCRFPHLLFFSGLALAFGPWFMPLSFDWKAVWLLAFQALGFGMILISVKSGKSIFSSFLKLPILGAIGLHSYSTYLMHPLVLEGIKVPLNWYKVSTGPRDLVILVGGLLLCFLTGGFFYRLVERPCLQLRDRISSHSHH